MVYQFLTAGFGQSCQDIQVAGSWCKGTFEYRLCAVMEVNGINIEIEYKPIKHIHLSVYPHEGNVHASVPEGMSE